MYLLVLFATDFFLIKKYSIEPIYYHMYIYISKHYIIILYNEKNHTTIKSALNILYAKICIFFACVENILHTTLIALNIYIGFYYFFILNTGCFIKQVIIVVQTYTYDTIHTLLYSIYTVAVVTQFFSRLIIFFGIYLI